MKNVSVIVCSLLLLCMGTIALLYGGKIEIDVIQVKIDVCSDKKEKNLEEKTVSKSTVQSAISEPNVYVRQYMLPNGLKLLVRANHTVPTVAVQIWYRVGSKNEHDRSIMNPIPGGGRGNAHLLEHMTFKGTKMQSESDNNAVTHKLSGTNNAFTSHDYTAYVFEVPSQNWKQVLPLMADCMENCTFKEEMLSSEMKAVIQELKMYRDKYLRTVIDEMIGFIFADHPYHHPIIGYKQDLWSVTSADLMAFYKKYYVPNNATLVVVGDVDPEEVYQQALKEFGHIKPNESCKEEQFYHAHDLVAKSCTLYRDIQQPQVLFAFEIPGARAKKAHIASLVSLILGQGNSSRLYKKIVDELQLATSISSMAEELFDHGLFFIAATPKDAASIDAIAAVIKQELESIVENGVTDEELTRAIKQTKMDFYCLLEENENQAYQIGSNFLATGDPDYAFNFLNYPYEQLKAEVNAMIAEYLRATVMHRGVVLPLPASEKAHWEKLQQLADEEDERILSGRIRTSEIEPPAYANTVKVGERNAFSFPKAKIATLSNGMKVLYYHTDNTPKIDIILSLGARSYCDSEELPGLYNFVTCMMTEGTKSYSAQEFANLIESRGISLMVSPGKIAMSLLSEDLSFGLEMLHELLTNAAFAQEEIEKVRAQLLSQVKSFWDNPNAFSGQLLREELYKGHPYSKNILGTEKAIQSITKKDLEQFYKKYITPQGARIAIVGDLHKHDLVRELESTLGKFTGQEVPSLTFPALVCDQPKEINYPINRDQIVLSFAGLSVNRKHPDYDRLMLFDQIFGGGVLGVMNSRLFALREQSGLFYTIAGSLTESAGEQPEQPGMVLVRTIVSPDRLDEAEKAIKNVMNTVVDTITPEEFEDARRGVINALVGNFTSTGRTAAAFLFLDRLNFPPEFFDERAKQLEKITLEEVKTAARKILQKEGLITLRVGRVGGTRTQSAQ